MSMQDITGHYAIPLAHPYSDVPPPYGRRRRPFVASRRQRPNVFDLYGARRVPPAAPEKTANVAKAVSARDFGSDNQAWVRPHPLRRKWRLTLMACAIFGAACIVATHFFEERQHAAEHGSVYSAAISVAPAVVAEVVAAEVTPRAGKPTESTAPQAARASGQDEQLASAAVVAVETASAASRALRAGSASPASAPVAVAVVVETNVVPADSAAPRARRASSANKPAAAMATRSAVKPAGAPHDKAAHAAPSVAAAASGATKQVQTARAAEAPPAAAQAVGMTAAEFTHWLAATRETARPAAAPARSDAGGTDLSVDLPSHTRLTAY
ncbi:serine protease [Burkholderia catarinensis]|nr:serine protease [Burkholderia catarinensis]